MRRHPPRVSAPPPCLSLGFRFRAFSSSNFRHLIGLLFSFILLFVILSFCYFANLSVRQSIICISYYQIFPSLRPYIVALSLIGCHLPNGLNSHHLDIALVGEPNFILVLGGFVDRLFPNGLNSHHLDIALVGEPNFVLVWVVC